jgi:tetratricopeptide (TPR) repeat protein
LALTLLAGFAGIAQSAPICGSQAEVLYRLAPALATHDPARLTMAYRAMGDYGMPAADIVEALVNVLGYRRLNKEEIEAAIAVFELNSETFPDSANAWDSLAEAVMANGDRDLAVRYYRRALEIDPDNQNAARIIEQMSGTPQLSHASDF